MKFSLHSGTRARRAIVLAAVPVLAALATTQLHGASPAKAAPAAGSLASGFQDKQSGAYFRAQLDSSQSDLGSFVAGIPGVGLVWAGAPATVTVESPQSDQLRYQGAGYLAPQAQLDTEFGVNYQPIGAINDETVRLVGQVDPTHGTGSIELWVNGTHYHLGAVDVPHTADATVTAYLTALHNRDFNALYALADDSVRNTMSQGAYVQALQADFPTAVSAATATGTTSYTINSAGIAYATTPISITAGENSAPQTGNLVLILDQGQWRIFTIS